MMADTEGMTGGQEWCPHCDVGFGYYDASPDVKFINTDVGDEIIVYSCPNCGEPFHNVECST